METEEPIYMMHSDASDVGWGAHGDENGEETAVCGELPAYGFGASSTAREIQGVLLAAECMVERLRGRRVRIYMDSNPAIQNFIKGGGPVPQLCALVKQWWVWCRRNKVSPLYTWKPREQNTRADELSKVAARAFTLTEQTMDEVRTWLESIGEPGRHSNEYLQTRVIAPHFNNIAVRIGEMRRARTPACIIVPRWPAAVWGRNLAAASMKSRQLGRLDSTTKQTQGTTTGGSMMEAHLIRVNERLPWQDQ